MSHFRLWSSPNLVSRKWRYGAVSGGLPVACSIRWSVHVPRFREVGDGEAVLEESHLRR